MNINYLVILIIPFLSSTILSAKIDKESRKRVLLYISLGFLLTNVLLVQQLFGIGFDDKLSSPINRLLFRTETLDQAMRLFDPLPNVNGVLPDSIFKPFLSPANVLFGFPGSLALFKGTWIALKAYLRPTIKQSPDSGEEIITGDDIVTGKQIGRAHV